eukprot:NODE_194_length_15414_cov_0.324127.p8 type:complete len:261 gc:universal NODE_194_length_15414_cov_0.324127:14100-14882(+)
MITLVTLLFSLFHNYFGRSHSKIDAEMNFDYLENYSLRDLSKDWKELVTFANMNFVENVEKVFSLQANGIQDFISTHPQDGNDIGFRAHLRVHFCSPLYRLVNSENTDTYKENCSMLSYLEFEPLDWLHFTTIRLYYITGKTRLDAIITSSLTLQFVKDNLILVEFMNEYRISTFVQNMSYIFKGEHENEWYKILARSVICEGEDVSISKNQLLARLGQHAFLRRTGKALFGENYAEFKIAYEESNWGTQANIFKAVLST